MRMKVQVVWSKVSLTFIKVTIVVAELAQKRPSLEILALSLCNSALQLYFANFQQLNSLHYYTHYSQKF